MVKMMCEALFLFVSYLFPFHTTPGFSKKPASVVNYALHAADRGFLPPTRGLQRRRSVKR